MKRETQIWGLVLGATCLLSVASGCATPDGTTPQQKREFIQSMRAETLEELFAQRPEARAKVQRAAGFGVFSDMGKQIIFVDTGNGFGVVRNNATGQDTYMKMVEVGGGFGLGLKKYKAVYIFNDPSVLNAFMSSGWEAVGNADATAKDGSEGGDETAGFTSGNLNGMEVYTFTEDGLSLSANVAAAKYYPDNALNGMDGE